MLIRQQRGFGLRIVQVVWRCDVDDIQIRLCHHLYGRAVGAFNVQRARFLRRTLLITPS